MWLIVRYALGLAVGVFDLDVARRQARRVHGRCSSPGSSELGVGHWRRSPPRRCRSWATRISNRGFFVGAARTIPLAPLTLVSMANNAIAYTVPGEPAVSSAYRYRFFRRHGASGASSGWTILTILIAQAIGMSLLLLVGVRHRAHREHRRAGARERHRRSVRRRDRGRSLVRRDLLLRFLGRARATVSTHHRSPARRRAGTHRVDVATDARDPTVERRGAVDWSRWRPRSGSSDFLILICCFGAVHAPIPWSGVLLAFGVAQIVASLPLIPGGIGIVEGSLAVILVAYGAKKVPALAVVLVYRLLTFWVVIIVGWISIGRHRVARASGHGAPVRRRRTSSPSAKPETIAIRHGPRARSK